MGPTARLEGVEAWLDTRAPFDGAALIEFLARRVIPGVEEVIDDSYRRSVRLPGGPAVVELVPEAHGVRLRADLARADDLAPAVERARALFDLDADPTAIAATLGVDPVLSPLVEAAPGRRVPGSVDAAELAVRAVLGQQVSLGAAITLAGRLVAECGEPLERPAGAVTHLFPTATALARLDPEHLAMPWSRRRALLGLCDALARGELVLDRGADAVAARERLLGLPGIGPWTAEYVAMRVLGDGDVFMLTDLGIRRGLERLGCDPSRAAALRLAERWRPYRAYAMQHLWAVAA
jgi:AraC family transcriptional regulator of adaptative response / DNA-3-methyladenine glycosylase II